MAPIAPIPAALDGERVDRVVSFLYGLSRAEAAALVAAGEVRVGGEAVTKGSVRVAEGDVVEVNVPEAPIRSLTPDLGVGVTVVHEDTDVVVVEKPAGLVVHPGAGWEQGTLAQGLLARYPELAEVGEVERPGIVHRLDKDTSGLLVVARTASAYQSLVAQLAARQVTRRYLALVWGQLDAPAGLIDAPIGRSAPTRMGVRELGRPARTRYEVVRSWSDPEVTLVACELETGRTHQVRVHLSAIGHPVVGDRRYRGWRQTLPLARFFLHATHLAFTHPSSDEEMAFDSPLPAELAAVLDGLDSARA